MAVINVEKSYSKPSEIPQVSNKTPRLALNPPLCSSFQILAFTNFSTGLKYLQKTLLGLHSR